MGLFFSYLLDFFSFNKYFTTQARIYFMKLNTLIFSSLFISQVWALECPPIAQAPLCPNSGATILDETYPTQAFVMSVGPGFRTNPPPSKEVARVTENFINSVVKSYNYDNVPQMMITTSSVAEFNLQKAKLIENLKKQKIPETKIEKIANQLTHVQNRAWTWQQDYFESFFDPKTGRPVLRNVETYSRLPSETDTIKLAASGQACAITKGEALPYDPQSTGSGEMGGNIEGAPGGFCLVGNNQGPDFKKSFCGPEENSITLNVAWLEVGHVDEIFKIIPTNQNDNRPKECKFSLMVASPRKALQLWSDSKNRNQPFFNFSAKLTDDELEDLRTSRSNIETGGASTSLCDLFVRAYKPSAGKKEGRGTGTKSAFLDFIFNSANAQTTSHAELAAQCNKTITEVTNGQFVDEVRKDKRLLEYNEAIQASLDKDTALIKSKILSRLPQCAKYFDVLEVPNYFEGGPLIEEPVTGKGRLPKVEGNGGSFLPNPTNSVLMNKTLLFSDAGSTAFNDYLAQEMKNRKMNADFIPTWEYAHIGRGNIHCSSHSIPYCRPRGSR